MKKFKIIFWTTTSLIALFEGGGTLLTYGSPMAIEGITHLGYPVYFVSLIGAFKVLGALALSIPRVPGRVKEWAYAGFGIDFISASVSIAVVDGLGFGAFFPLIFLGLLIASYVSYHKVYDMSSVKA